MGSISDFIEKRMKLIINREKSKVAKSNKVKFLGFTIVKGTIAISKQAMEKAINKIKELTPRGTSKTIEQTIVEFNKWFIGWTEYFKLTYYPAQIQKIEARFRRRLRARIVSQQKRRKHLYSTLIKRGIKPRTAAKAAFSLCQP